MSDKPFPTPDIPIPWSPESAKDYLDNPMDEGRFDNLTEWNIAVIKAEIINLRNIGTALHEAYEVMREDRDLWKETEATCNRMYNELQQQLEAANKEIERLKGIELFHFEQAKQEAKKK